MSKLWCDDCLSILPKLVGRSIDLIYCDLPYGTTANKWDSIIPLDQMWEQVGRLIKVGRPIVFHAAEPFTSKLICSRLDWFRYRWTWNKVNRITGYLDAKRRPLRVVEDIVVFSSKGHPVPYNPQMTYGPPQIYKRKRGDSGSNYNEAGGATTFTDNKYPIDLLDICCEALSNRVHPTQKPVAVAEYFIKTYSNPGDVVLDFAMGAGTAGIAAARLGRKFVGVEKDADMFELAKRRIDAAEKYGIILNKMKQSSGFFGPSKV